MKTADFTGELTPSGEIAVPPEIASQVPPGEQIQVILHLGDLGRRYRVAGGRAAAVRGGVRR
jgi:hypothetical protein